MAREGDGAELAVPPTIQALLAARLDQLDPAERGVLERGSVEGRSSTAARCTRSPPRSPSRRRALTALVRKELVRPEQPMLPARTPFASGTC